MPPREEGKLEAEAARLEELLVRERTWSTGEEKEVTGFTNALNNHSMQLTLASGRARGREPTARPIENI